MNALTNIGGAQTMSSREIAELCDKRHDHVLRDIRTMLAGLYGDEEVQTGIPDRDKYEAFFEKMGWGIDSPDLGNGRIAGIRVDRDARGFLSEIRLDYNHTMTLIAGYKVKLRKAIIDKWQQLEEAERNRFDPAIALSDPASLRRLLLQNVDKVLELQGKVEEMHPQVQALERIAISDGSLCITDAAKTLQVQPKALFSYLREHHWIYTRQGDSSYIAYQAKLQTGLLEHKTTVVTRSDGSEKTTTQVRVTPKGLTALAKLFPPAATAA